MYAMELPICILLKHSALIHLRIELNATKIDLNHYLLLIAVMILKRKKLLYISYLKSTDISMMIHQCFLDYLSYLFQIPIFFLVNILYEQCPISLGLFILYSFTTIEKYSSITFFSITLSDFSFSPKFPLLILQGSSS